MNPNPTSTASASVSTSPDAVSRRAYEIWESEGRPEGAELRHWLQAEQELNVSSTPISQSAANASAPRSGGTSRHTDARPLQGTRAAGAAARESSKRSTAPFERSTPAGGAQPTGAKRR